METPLLMETQASPPSEGGRFPIVFDPMSFSILFPFVFVQECLIAREGGERWGFLDFWTN